MTRRLLKYGLEFLVVLLIFLAVFVAYHVKSEPTRFIYYNF